MIKILKEYQIKNGRIKCLVEVNGSKTFMNKSRIIMCNHLNRILDPWEDVHHINGNSADDRIDNLLVVDAVDHIQLHHSK